MHPPNCPSHDVLLRFARGNLDEILENQLTNHLKDCTSCNETIDSIDSIDIEADTLLDSLRETSVTDAFLDEPQLQECLEQLSRSAIANARPKKAVASPQQPSNSSASESNLDRDPGFGNYRLLAKIGEGGMGAVYKAKHTKLDKLIAIKVLTPGRLGDQRAVDRFEQEMKAIGRVQHPNVIVAHDAGQIDDQHYLVMEFVDGIDVAELIRTVGDSQGRLPNAVACEIVRQAAVGLQHAHEQGIVHRDIKPSNLMLDSLGVVKVLDLGLARIDPKRDDQTGATSETNAELTATGTAMGTVGYMAPEQALDSRRVDQRTDVYSLGVTLYRLLTGQLPFSSKEYDTAGKMLVAIATEEPTSIQVHRPDLPSPLVALIDSMLAKSPEDRVSQASDIVEQLKPYAEISLAGLTSGKVRAASLAEPSIITPSKASGSQRDWRIPMVCTAAGLALVFLMYLAGQFFKIQTEHGTLVVEVVGNDVQALLQSDGIEVIDKASNRRWTVAPRPGRPQPLPVGDYRFDVPAGLIITDAQGLRIDANVFKLVDANEQLRIRVSMASADSDTEVDPAADAQLQDPYAHDREALKWVLKAGGTYGPIADSESLGNLDRKELRYETINLLRANVSNHDLRLIKSLPQLRNLNLAMTDVDAGCLSYLAANPNVIDLNVSHTGIKLSDLVAVKEWPFFSRLSISPDQIDVPWDFLENFPSLRVLVVSNSALSPAGLDVDLTGIDQVPQLRLIEFQSKIWADDEAIQKAQSDNPALGFHKRVGGKWVTLGASPRSTLQSARKLADNRWTITGHRPNGDDWSPEQADAWDENRWIVIRSIAAPDGHVFTLGDTDLLANIPIVDRLDLSGTQGLVIDRDLFRSGPPWSVDLANSNVTDEDLQELATCNLWRSIALEGTPITREGLQRFQSLQPTCEIVSSPFGPFPATNRFPNPKHKTPALADRYLTDRQVSQWATSVGGSTSADIGRNLDRSSSIGDRSGEDLDAIVEVLKLRNVQQLPLRMLHKMTRLPSLSHLLLAGTPIDRANFHTVLQMKNLQSLGVAGTKLDSIDFSQCTHLKRLRVLSLQPHQVTDAWAFLGELPGLSLMHIHGRVIPDVAELAKFPHPRTIILHSHVKPDEATVNELRKLDPHRIVIHFVTNDDRFYVGGNPVGSAAQELAKVGWTFEGHYCDNGRWDLAKESLNPSNKRLYIQDAQAPDDFNVTIENSDQIGLLATDLLKLKMKGATGVKHLSNALRYGNLNQLDLRHSDLDDKTLLAIAAVISPSLIDITGTQVTAQGIEAFKRILPTCAVRSSFGDFPYQHQMPDSL